MTINPDSFPVTYRRKVRYSDTDVQGIVFNGNYFTYIDDTLTDYYDALGSVWDRLHEEGYDLVLGHVEVDYLSPARLGDVILTGMRAIQVGNTSLVFEVATWEEATGRPIIRGRNVQVMVDATTLQKRPVPPLLIEAIESLQGAPLSRKSQL
jgi:acyl-CoA thioester hydrolase